MTHPLSAVPIAALILSLSVPGGGGLMTSLAWATEPASRAPITRPMDALEEGPAVSRMLTLTIMNQRGKKRIRLNHRFGPVKDRQFEFGGKKR